MNKKTTPGDMTEPLSAPAAAPQVVADERAAFEARVKQFAKDSNVGRYTEEGARHNNEVWQAPDWTPVACGDYIASSISFGWRMWQARAALASAPVQAQEPESMKLLRSLWSDEGLRQLMRPDQQRRIEECLATVQPVAMPDGVAKLKHERDTLAQGIADAALKSGIWNGEVNLTGPHLLMMLGDMASCIAAENAELTDEQITEVWQSMPGGPHGWLKSFGFIQFARAAIAASKAAA